MSTTQQKTACIPLSCGETGEIRGRRVIVMRRIVLAGLAATALTFACMMPAQAVGSRHAFCIQGNEYPGLSNCTFDSYDQCMASASGRFLYCVANPYFVGQSDDPYAYQNRNRPFPPNYYPVQPGYYPRSRY
jgi:hypothetical protein